MTKFLATAAMAALLAMPAAAQTATGTPPATTPATPAAPMGTHAATGFGYTAMTGDMSAETLLGKRLYVSEANVDPAVAMNEADEGWDDIGEVSDLVLSREGQVKAVIADIGGFLGIGEKSVAVAMNQLRFVRDGDSPNEYFVVFTANRDALENAPAFEWPSN